MQKIAEAIALSFDVAEFKHIKDFYIQGTHDDVWVPQIASEKCWIVISSDRSKQTKTANSKGYKGEKLRVICKKHDVTLVEVSQKIHHLSTTDKIAALIYVWPDLMNLGNAPRGSRHLIRFKGSRPGKPIIESFDADETTE
jgi:hypothetical protein